MPTALSIQKRLIRDEYNKSPIGQAEKKLKGLYDAMVLNGQKLPEDIAKIVFELRDKNEKAQMSYIEEAQKRDREAIDSMLMESFNEEIKILEDYQSKALSMNKW